MGMSTHIKGVREPTEQFKKMRTAWFACVEAGCEPPEEVLSYFDETTPTTNGDEVQITVHPYRPYEMAEGHRIILSELPDDVHEIVFYNSW